MSGFNWMDGVFYPNLCHFLRKMKSWRWSDIRVSLRFLSIDLYKMPYIRFSYDYNQIKKKHNEHKSSWSDSCASGGSSSPDSVSFRTKKEKKDSRGVSAGWCGWSWHSGEQPACRPASAGPWWRPAGSTVSARAGRGTLWMSPPSSTWAYWSRSSW